MHLYSAFLELSKHFCLFLRACTQGRQAFFKSQPYYIIYRQPINSVPKEYSFFVSLLIFFKPFLKIENFQNWI